MNWIWISLVVIVGCAIINPILYFIYWELYKRREWIEDKTAQKSDERFFDLESYWDTDIDGLKQQYTRQVQIAPVRPQVRDVWMSMDNYWMWWFPVANSIAVIFYTCAIIVRPFEQSWKCVVRKIANINV